MFDRAVGEERIATARRLSRIAVAQGWLELAAEDYRALLALDATLGDEELTAIAEVARAGDDTELMRSVIKRRITTTVDPRDASTWLERLGEIDGGKLGRPGAAAAAFRQAAEASALAGDAASARRLHERVLAVMPDDRAAATALLALYRDAGAWDRVPGVVAVLLRTAPDAEAAARALLEHEDALRHAGAAAWFLEQAAEALAPARAGALLAELRASLRAARVRVLALDPARDAEVAAAYRDILEAGEGDVDATAAAFEDFLAARARRARRIAGGSSVSARRGRASRTACGSSWRGPRPRQSLGDPEAAAELYERVIALDPEHDAALSARARILLVRGDAEGAVSLLVQRRDRAEGRRASSKISRWRRFFWSGSIGRPRRWSGSRRSSTRARSGRRSRW